MDDLMRELQKILAAIERNNHPRLSRSVQRTLQTLLPMIVSVVGDAPFAAADLVSEDAPPAIRACLPKPSAQALGCLLRSAEPHSVGRYRVRKAGEEAGTVLWRVESAP